MTTTVAIINSEGEIVQIYSSGQEVEAEGPWGPDNSMTVVHISGGVGNTNTFITQQYYKDGVWLERSVRPNTYYNWKDEAWVQDVAGLYAAVRQERGNLLTMSDWTQYVDSPLTDQKKFEWAEYRQTLRDIMAILPSDLKDPEDLQWPTPPS